NWLRCGLTAVGVQYLWVPPAALLLAFLAWAWGRWDDRPKDLLGVMTGMVIESVTFALGLWGLSRGLAPLLQQCGIELAVPAEGGEPALRQAVTYLGAGIYEEALFRLVLFTALAKLLGSLDIGEPLAAALAALASATLFAVAHHIGPYGQPYSNYLFLFR